MDDSKAETLIKSLAGDNDKLKAAYTQTYNFAKEIKTMSVDTLA